MGLASEKSSLSVRSTNEMPMRNPEESSPTLLKDTMVQSGRPDLLMGTHSHFYVGMDKYSNPPYLLQQALLMFRIPEEMRDQTLATAKLRLYLSGTTPNDAPLRINVRRATNNWDENITWNTMSTITVYPDYAPSSIPSTLYRWYEIDVKSLVEAWKLVPDTTNLISFMLASDLDASSPSRERVFFTKDHTDPSLAPQLVIVAGTQSTPTPGSVTYPSYCGCEATVKYRLENDACGSNPMTCSQPSSVNGMSGVNRLENDVCYQTQYFCANGGVPPAGNCNCDLAGTDDYTGMLPSKELCYGRNAVLNSCILPGNTSWSGAKHVWRNNRCIVERYSCTTSSQPPMSLQIYAGEYMKMMRGQAFDPNIDVNGDNVRDLRDFYRLWQMWREQGTAHAPARAGEESGAVVGPIDM